MSRLTTGLAVAGVLTLPSGPGAARDKAADGDTGITSFLVANDGVVLEADLGPDTDVRTHVMVACDPDPSWQSSTDWAPRQEDRPCTPPAA